MEKELPCVDCGQPTKKAVGIISPTPGESIGVPLCEACIQKNFTGVPTSIEGFRQLEVFCHKHKDANIFPPDF